MKRPNLRAFTLVELLVVISIIALLVGILLPAISRARDNAQIGQSKSNIRNIHTACNLYSNDHRGKQWIGAPENLSSGPDGSWTGLSAQNALGQWAQRYHVAQTGGGGTKATIYPGIKACELDGGVHYYSERIDNVAPFLFDSGLTTSYQNLFPRTGAWRTPNTRQIAEYMEDKCYHKAYWAPKDRVITRELQQCWDADGTMCSTSLIDPQAALDIPLLLQPSTYSWSAANMMNCYVFDTPADGANPSEFFNDPMSFAAGFRAPTMSQAKYSSQKTYLMETHWLQNLTTGECGANWGDSSAAYHVAQGDANENTWSYDGCYPHYFNASWRSMPVASMCDGSVTGVSAEVAEKHDYVVAGQRGSTGDVAQYNGLWHRGTPSGADGFFVECRSDWAQWSGHVLTTGGMCEGRDLLAED